MGLATDSIFVTALKTNDSLMQTVGQRLYGTAIPFPDDDADNVPVPYIIVTFEGLSNDDQTKDFPYEGEWDTVNIGITVAAGTLDQLHALTEETRSTILAYMTATETPVADYRFTAQGIQYDSLKPCYWQVLGYSCDVKNSINGTDED